MWKMPPRLGVWAAASREPRPPPAAPMTPAAAAALPSFRTSRRLTVGELSIDPLLAPRRRRANSSRSPGPADRRRPRSARDHSIARARGGRLRVQPGEVLGDHAVGREALDADADGGAHH